MRSSEHSVTGMASKNLTGFELPPGQAKLLLPLCIKQNERFAVSLRIVPCTVPAFLPVIGCMRNQDEHSNCRTSPPDVTSAGNREGN